MYSVAISHNIEVRFNNYFSDLFHRLVSMLVWLSDTSLSLSHFIPRPAVT